MSHFCLFAVSRVAIHKLRVDRHRASVNKASTAVKSIRFVKDVAPPLMNEPNDGSARASKNAVIFFAGMGLIIYVITKCCP